MAPALGAVLLVAPAAGLSIANPVLPGAAGFVTGGVFAHLATLPRRRQRFVAGLLVLTSVLAAAGVLVAFYSQDLPPPPRAAWAPPGRNAFWFAFGTLNVALLRRPSTTGGRGGDR